MRRATALAVPLRRLSRSNSSHFDAIHSQNVCRGPKSQKKLQKKHFWEGGFKVIQGHQS